MFSTMQQSIVSNPTNEQQGAKKRKLSNENKSNSPSIDRSKITHHPPRILARRYPLTKTGYKYLDIGINVSTPSYVEIALGDNHGKEIHFTYNVWKVLLDQRDTIHHFFNNDEDEAHTSSQTIGHITLHFGKMNNLKILRLETSALCLAMSSNTVYNMIALEYCIDCITQSLNNITGMVDAKFARFREIASGAKDPIAIHTAIRESKSFDKNNIVDCELLAQVFAL